jgi:hypothetical protein
MIDTQRIFRTLAPVGLVVLASASCAAPETDLEGDDLASTQDALSSSMIAYNGMCVGLTAIDFTKERCAPSDLPELMDFVQATDPVVYEFLSTALDGMAMIQCTSYLADDGSTAYCADVVDRDPLGDALDGQASEPGGRRNFFVAYASLAPWHPERPYWNAHLDGVAPPRDYRVPPVELSQAGTFSTGGAWNPGPSPQGHHLRVLKFDPRDCSGCGIYKGPSLRDTDYINERGQRQVRYGWWPVFDAGLYGCVIEPEMGARLASYSIFKTDEDCRAEYVYRTMTR